MSELFRIISSSVKVYDSNEFKQCNRNIVVENRKHLPIVESSLFRLPRTFESNAFVSEQRVKEIKILAH